MLMEIYVIGLHNNMLKSSDNFGFASVVDYVTQKAVISDTTLG